MMTPAIIDKVGRLELAESDCFQDEPGLPDEQFFDDGFVHVRRSGTRFVFYNGEGIKALMRKDVSRCALLVDVIIAKENEQ